MPATIISLLNNKVKQLLTNPQTDFLSGFFAAIPRKTEVGRRLAAWRPAFYNGGAMGMNEADTRANLIDPALRDRGWSKDLIKREETAGEVDIIGGIPRRRDKRVDYTLRVVSSGGPQPVALALIEAKAEDRSPGFGLQQAKGYADRMNVPFVYSTNGHRFVEYDRFTGKTSPARNLKEEFPTPAELLSRYEQHQRFKLDSAAARPLVTPYPQGENQRRYYQDAAIRAVLEKAAQGEKRALLSLATGSGKTYIAVQLLRRLADAEQLRKALFLCDRDELRTQGLAAFSNEFGSDAAAARAGNPQKNARIIIATYQTLGIDRVDADASFLTTHYPPDYFSHIIIDECHRSAWNKWRGVLERNPQAMQIGLTATPRQFSYPKDLDAADSVAAQDDQRISADNYDYFGEPIYEYPLSQGIADGYLARMEVVKNDIFLDGILEELGLRRDNLAGKRLVDAHTGRLVTIDEPHEHYNAPRFEDILILPDRVAAMCRDLFDHLAADGGPRQKTIIFCARDEHADAVANEMNNLYAEWSKANGQPPQEHYAFKCTAAVEGQKLIADFKASSQRYFVATTVDLLTTGVDVPAARNIVFFRYVQSPIAFYQMLGRGTRIDERSDKLTFRVYDYTNATRLWAAADIPAGPAKTRRRKGPPPEPERVIEACGFQVVIKPAGHFILAADGSLISLGDYKGELAARLLAEVPSLDDFRAAWRQPAARQELVAALPEAGANLIRYLENKEECDLFDVLAELGYNQYALTRAARAEAFFYKNLDWLETLPDGAAGVLRALVSQFAKAGTPAWENDRLFQTPEVVQAGGFAALQAHGDPGQILTDTRTRMFAL